MVNATIGAQPLDAANIVSWFIRGEIVHNDSLGSEALLRPGGVNVMTSGAGIAHAEETPAENSGLLNGNAARRRRRY